MKIVADMHIPFLAEAVLREWPEVVFSPLEPDQIDALSVRDADVLVVRTRTNINKSLLEGSRVRMVCTATIGFDHIDTVYCAARGIRWMSCPGCNAQAVCDYIEEALEELQSTYVNLIHPVIGIVGVGHVGTLVAKMAERKGKKVLLNDPPKGIGVSLDEIAANSDIITFHVPLDATTRYICDETFLGRCKPDAVIVNAARGGIVDEQALLRSGHMYILDTWENEPNIDQDVLRGAFRASMHIAGYSVQGKRNATQMCLDAIAEQFVLPAIDISQYIYNNGQAESIKNSNEPWLAAVTKDFKEHPTAFESLRKSYPLRGE